MKICRKGFTLIELLVVIAIIAILAAILFPVFARAKSKAQITTCLTYQKQWGIALLSYLDDNNGKFPFAGAAKTPEYAHDARKPPFGIGGSEACYEALHTYAKGSEKLRWCPSWIAANKAYSGLGWSYWYFCPHSKTGGNQFVKGYNNGKAALCGYAMSDLTQPSRKPAITEIWSGHKGYGETSFYNFPVVYCDGHVKVLNIGKNELPELIAALYVGRDGSVP